MSCYIFKKELIQKYQGYMFTVHAHQCQNTYNIVFGSVSINVSLHLIVFNEYMLYTYY